jgi:hypothetical protein
MRGRRKASMKIVPMQREEEMREGRPTQAISPIPAPWIGRNEERTDTIVV